MAMPMERAVAAARDISDTPACQLAYTTPTAIPSGILWMITANTSIMVLEKEHLGPSCS